MAQIGPMSAMTCPGVGRSNPPYRAMIGRSAIAAITTRAATLAIAAPVSSKPKPKIRIGSSTAVATAPQTVAIIAARASPWLRRMAPPIMPTINSGWEGTTIARKCTARSAVSPVAPRSATSGPSASQTTPAKSDPKTKPRTSPVVAFSRASAGSRAPSARATRAPTAIDMPIPKLVVKNRIAPA